MAVRYVDNSRAVLSAVEQATMKPLLRCGLILERAAKRSMKMGGRSTGPRGGKVQTPSAEGEPPNVQTGNLRASISHAPTEQRTVVVGPSAWYGQVHEFGGRNHPRRPFMRPSLDKSRSEFPAEFKNLPIAETPAGRRLK